MDKTKESYVFFGSAVMAGAPLYMPWFIPALAPYMFWIGITGLVSTIILHVRDTIRSRKKPPSGPAETNLIDLLTSSPSCGWDLQEAGGLQYLDIFDAIRQHGLDGKIVVKGRKFNKMDVLMKNQPRQTIPPEHWKDYQINLWGAVDMKNGTPKNDNYTTNSYKVTTGDDHRSGGYVDLQISGVDITKWLKNDAQEFKGRREKQDEEDKTRFAELRGNE